MTLFEAFLLFITVEVLLIICVRTQRRAFHWLITEKDERPLLKRATVDKFITKSHDPQLGWVTRPGTSGVEVGRDGLVQYHIDDDGSRISSGNYPPKVAAFGDSYVFCRQVENDQTWESQWAHSQKIGILNFGVGNYGVDQALIRYESTSLPPSVTHVILGFVPETICRIHSTWKHYLEFGNTLAFKPRFTLDSKGSLTLINNLMRTANDFYELDKHIPELRNTDLFYKSKFRSVQFRIPYTLSFVKHPLRNVALMSAIAARASARLIGIKRHAVENLPFKVIMRENIRASHAMYRVKEATTLLETILRRFVNEASRRGHNPIIVVMPQLLDLRIADRKRAYCSFFEKLAIELPVIDLTRELQVADFESCYVNDHYGGHLSVRGNQLVARSLSRRFAEEVKIV